MSKARSSPLTLVMLIAILLAAFALRLFQIETQSLWWDEGISLHLATASLAEIVADRAANLHPPLYFIGLKTWLALTGVTPFSARYFSLLASLLQVAVVYAVARRWLGNWTVWVAVLFVVLSPLSVIYGQETRVYAFLPLIYLGLLAVTEWLVRHPDVERIGPWLWLGVLQWTAIHLHYIAFMAVAYVGGWFLLASLRRRQWLALRRWFVTQLGVALASIPWLVAVLVNWTAVQNRINTGRFSSESVPLPFLANQVWTFHLTGLAGIATHPEVHFLALSAAVLLLFLLFIRLSNPAWRARALRLSAQWLIPLSIAFSLWSLRSFSHPRYVIIFAIALFPLAAYLIYPGAAGRNAFPVTFLASLLGVSILLLSLAGLHTYFFDAGVAKNDVRAVARYLETEATSDDLILVPDTDWSLPFEYRGHAPVAMPGVASWQRETMWSHLHALTRGKQRVFVLDYAQGTHDWQDVVQFVLEKEGALVEETKMDDLVVRLYQLERAAEPPALSVVNARFGTLLLPSAWVESAVPADSAITAAFRWRLARTVDEQYRAALRLLDVDGRMLAAKDVVLVDENGRFTSQWAAGQPVTTYHILPLPPAMPPLTYTFSLEVYQQTAAGSRPLDLLDEQGAPQGQTLAVATVSLTRPALPANNPYGIENDLPLLATPRPFTAGLELLAAALDRQALAPGQPLFVTLLWQATQPALPALQPQLSLVQDGNVLATGEAPLLARYPTSQWQTGERVREHRRLLVPPQAGGVAEVVLALNEQRVVLAEVEITAADPVFQPPPIPYPLDVEFGRVARLAGYDLPRQSVTTAEPVPLTLYWQALSGGAEQEYTVFAHILGEDGRLIGQHDAPPGNGRRPTSGWVEGEFIIDPHDMVFKQEAYRGAARIEVGLYDPVTGVRLETGSGSDAFYLPLTLEVE